MFLDNYVVQRQVSRKRAPDCIEKKRTVSLTYTFANVDPTMENITVCKKMFLPNLRTKVMHVYLLI